MLLTYEVKTDPLMSFGVPNDIKSVLIIMCLECVYNVFGVGAAFYYSVWSFKIYMKMFYFEAV